MSVASIDAGCSGRLRLVKPMLRLSKRVEYGLLAVQAMSCAPECIVSAKDIARRFDISLALVAKVLQQLVRAELVTSFHGTNGGYTLARKANQVSVADVINAIEGADASIVNCQEHSADECSVLDSCTIREPLSVLQLRIQETLASMSVAELTPINQLVQLEVL